jgi:hypothetical protein
LRTPISECRDRGIYCAVQDHTRSYADRIDLASMTPSVDLASTGYCLAKSNRSSWSSFLPEGNFTTVDVSKVPGGWRA